MPMHDWTRVDPGMYHDFHGLWLMAIRRQLNHGLLPEGYFAVNEQVLHPVLPDVVTLHADSAPHPGNIPLATLHPPKAQITANERKRIKVPSRRIAVRHVSGNRVVAVIELMSPGNKSGRRDFDRFVSKAVAVIDRGINLLIIDPFPSTRRDPNGIHGALWKELVGKPFQQPDLRPLTVASYVAGETIRCFVEPFAVNEMVPSIPLFLDPDAYITIPLDESYRAAMAEYPPTWRILLEPEH